MTRSVYATRSIESRDNWPLGYLGAVVAATIVFAVSETAWHALRFGLSFLRSDLLSVELLATFVVVLVFAPVAGVTALLPFLGVCKIAEHFGIKTGIYYAVCGVVTGLVLTPVGHFLGILSPTIPSLDPDLEPTLWQGMKALGPFFMLSGAAGGLTYWWISVRRL